MCYCRPEDRAFRDEISIARPDTESRGGKRMIIYDTHDSPTRAESDGTGGSVSIGRCLRTKRPLPDPTLSAIVGCTEIRSKTSVILPSSLSSVGLVSGRFVVHERVKSQIVVYPSLSLPITFSFVSVDFN